MQTKHSLKLVRSSQKKGHCAENKILSAICNKNDHNKNGYHVSKKKKKTSKLNAVSHL